MNTPSPADIIRGTLRCEPAAIHRDVILTPHWKAEIFEPFVRSLTVIVPDVVYEIEMRGRIITLIRSGIGAPLTGDAVLVLGTTACKRLIFIGSAGGLAPEVNIGDLLVPSVSLSGDGFSRYLQASLSPTDTFLQPAASNPGLTAALLGYAEENSRSAGIAVHKGRVFSTDSIVAQFPLLDALASQHACLAVEMETAAVFAAAQHVGIQAAALLAISDSPLKDKSLFSGRTAEDSAHYQAIKTNVLPKILLDTLAGPRYCEG